MQKRGGGLKNRIPRIPMVYYTQKSIKCVKDLNVRFEIVKLLELSRGETLDNIGFGKDFLVMNTIGNFLKN